MIDNQIEIQNESDKDEFDFLDGNIIEEEDKINDVKFGNTKQNFDLMQNSSIIDQ